MSERVKTPKLHNQKWNSVLPLASEGHGVFPNDEGVAHSSFSCVHSPGQEWSSQTSQTGVCYHDYRGLSRKAYVSRGPFILYTE